MLLVKTVIKSSLRYNMAAWNFYCVSELWLVGSRMRRRYILRKCRFSYDIQWKEGRSIKRKEEEMYTACVSPYAALQTEGDVTRSRKYLTTVGGSELGLTPSLLLVLVWNYVWNYVSMKTSMDCMITVVFSGPDLLRKYESAANFNNSWSCF